jgi:hypothetical protein
VSFTSSASLCFNGKFLPRRLIGYAKLAMCARTISFILKRDGKTRFNEGSSDICLKMSAEKVIRLFEPGNKICLHLYIMGQEIQILSQPQVTYPSSRSRCCVNLARLLYRCLLMLTHKVIPLKYGMTFMEILFQFGISPFRSKNTCKVIA